MLDERRLPTATALLAALAVMAQPRQHGAMNQSRLIGYVLAAGVAALSLSAGCSGSDSSSFGSEATGTSATATTGTSAGGAGGAGTTGTTGTEATSSATGTGGSQGTGGSGGLAAGDLVISEIMNNPGTVSDDSGEWFEVHNATGQPIDLAGLELVSGSAVHTIASPVKIAANGYAVLGANAMTATNGGVPVDYQYTLIKLQNTTGNLTIRTTAMLVIDTTSYDEASGLDPDGRSRTLDPKFLSASMNDTDAHWCAGSSYIKGNTGDQGTPGKANDACP
jgi:hypothetical protein